MMEIEVYSFFCVRMLEGGRSSGLELCVSPDGDVLTIWQVYCGVPVSEPGWTPSLFHRYSGNAYLYKATQIVVAQ